MLLLKAEKNMLPQRGQLIKEVETSSVFLGVKTKIKTLQQSHQD